MFPAYMETNRLKLIYLLHYEMEYIAVTMIFS